MAFSYLCQHIIIISIFKQNLKTFTAFIYFIFTSVIQFNIKWVIILKYGNWVYNIGYIIKLFCLLFKTILSVENSTNATYRGAVGWSRAAALTMITGSLIEATKLTRHLAFYYDL